jgi:hypothetical protein
MKVLEAFRNGARAAFTIASFRALGWCYGASLIVTLLFTIPLYALVRSTVAGSAMAEELRSGRTADWLVDLAGAGSIAPAARSLVVAAVVLVPVYLLLVVLFSGGVLASLRDALGLGPKVPSFLAASAEVAGAMMRVALVELPTIGLSLVVLVMARLALAMVASGPLVAWSWLAISIAALAFVTSVFDFARVGIALRSAPGSLAALGDALRFSFGRFMTVFGLSTLNAAVAGVVFVLFVWLHSLLRIDTGLGIFFGLVVGQLSIAARLWCRLSAYASEMALRSSAERG